jgi:hypothetical protein
MGYLFATMNRYLRAGIPEHPEHRLNADRLKPKPRDHAPEVRRRAAAPPAEPLDPRVIWAWDKRRVRNVEPSRSADGQHAAPHDRAVPRSEAKDEHHPGEMGTGPSVPCLPAVRS